MKDAATMPEKCTPVSFVGVCEGADCGCNRFLIVVHLRYGLSAVSIAFRVVFLSRAGDQVICSTTCFSILDEVLLSLCFHPSPFRPFLLTLDNIASFDSQGVACLLFTFSFV